MRQASVTVRYASINHLQARLTRRFCTSSLQSQRISPFGNSRHPAACVIQVWASACLQAPHCDAEPHTIIEATMSNGAEVDRSKTDQPTISTVADDYSSSSLQPNIKNGQAGMKTGPKCGCCDVSYYSVSRHACLRSCKFYLASHTEPSDELRLVSGCHLLA